MGFLTDSKPRASVLGFKLVKQVKARIEFRHSQYIPPGLSRSRHGQPGLGTAKHCANKQAGY